MSTELKSGFLLVHKPSGMNSFGCIMHLKKIVGKKIKIGHAGTLDPFASGLLIIAIGREATALISQLMCLDKIYQATAKLGELTDTLDCMGTVTTTCGVVISQDHIQRALNSFGESYEQIPPLYSALKHGGQPLYKLARKKKIDAQALALIAQSKKRVVIFYELALLAFEYPMFTVKAHVSHGTYIRSLMNDIAARAGSCATSYTLERSAIGVFSSEQAVTLDRIVTVEDINKHLIFLDNMMLLLSK